MWLVMTYRPTSLFSLRTSSSTSSGGKTHLIPTMYSIKMALLSNLYRLGMDAADHFNWIRDLSIKIEVPEEAVVNNSFVKIQMEARDKKPGLSFTSNVGFREYVYYRGWLRIAIETNGLQNEQKDLLERLLWHINYLGKRGSFMQATEVHEIGETPSTFTRLLGEMGTYSEQVMMQYLDDMGEKATFKGINPYDVTKATIGRDRMLMPVYLPYRKAESSRGYTLYKR